MIVDRVDEAKKAARVTELCLMRCIDRRHDTADRFSVSERHKWLDDVLAQEWRPPPIEGHAELFVNWFDPTRIDRLRAPSGAR